MNESPNFGVLGLFTIVSESGEVIFYGEEEIADKKLINRVGAIFKSDPRIASISIPLSMVGQDLQLVKCKTPAESNFFVNQDLADLVGEIPSANFLGTEIADWNIEATRRGLHHYSLSTKSMNLANDNLNPALVFSTADALGFSGDLNLREKNSPQSLRVLVDCEWIRENETGSQVATISLISELNNHPGISSLGLINWPHEAPNYACKVPSLAKVSIVSIAEDFPCEIFWRPYQPSMNLDFFNLGEGSRRLVITLLDSISYNNESYFNSAEDWDLYRDMFHSAALSADMVLCISEDVKNQLALDDHGIDPRRIRVAELGTNHLENDTKDDLRENEITEFLQGRKYVLLLGSQYAHKNVDFGMKVVSEARRRGSDVTLVIVGLKIENNNKPVGEPESDWLFNLGHVDSAIRNLLMKNASAVLYPTSAEGFGLVPFEAALLGTPTVATRFGPMVEVLPAEYSTKSWNLEEYVSLLILLTTSQKLATEQITHINSISEKMTWENSAEKLITAFESSMTIPKNPAREVVSVINHQVIVAKKLIHDFEIDQDYLKARLEIESKLNVELQNSYSWKITAPIRALHKKLLGR